MKVAHWVDSNGYQRVSVVHDEDSVLEAVHGLRKGPPDITTLDWENIIRDLHNELVSRGLFSYQDIIRSKSGVSGAITSALRRRVIELYKQRR